ncbi:MAG: hypothetical protein LBJ01_01525, partial [Tannerella sp.]|nr:hypothetical protein [Tannerella sp.]
FSFSPSCIPAYVAPDRRDPGETKPENVRIPEYATLLGLKNCATQPGTARLYFRTSPGLQDRTLHPEKMSPERIAICGEMTDRTREAPGITGEIKVITGEMKSVWDEMKPVTGEMKVKNWKMKSVSPVTDFISPVTGFKNGKAVFVSPVTGFISPQTDFISSLMSFISPVMPGLWEEKATKRSQTINNKPLLTDN